MNEINNLKKISTKHSAEFSETKYREEESYGIWKWFTIALKNVLNFKGRSRRKEYLSYGLFSTVIIIAVLLLLGTYSNEFLETVAGGLFLFILIPLFALNTRRLHDIGLPGYLQLTVIIPIIWAFIGLFCMFRESSPKNNKWGAPAKRVKPDE